MNKPLIIFDIDGTLTATIKVDDYGFVQTYEDLYQIDLGKTDWNKFVNVTDQGITNQVFQEKFKRLPTTAEIDYVKEHFLTLLTRQYKNEPGNFSEVSGAVDFVNELRDKNFPIAIATGGWEETARFKLEKIGLELSEIPFANSNHHFSRREITEYAIDLAKEKYSTDFQRIIYFGDGQWDLLNCRELEIEFIGVDFYENGKLKNLGAGYVIKDFLSKTEILDFLEKTTGTK
jgi:phosphoglycolate phosphatase-like HAD superfamily hydrolase